MAARDIYQSLVLSNFVPHPQSFLSESREVKGKKKEKKGLTRIQEMRFRTTSTCPLSVQRASGFVTWLAVQVGYLFLFLFLSLFY